MSGKKRIENIQNTTFHKLIFFKYRFAYFITLYFTPVISLWITSLSMKTWLFDDLMIWSIILNKIGAARLTKSWYVCSEITNTKLTHHLGEILISPRDLKVTQPSLFCVFLSCIPVMQSKKMQQNMHFSNLLLSQNYTHTKTVGSEVKQMYLWRACMCEIQIGAGQSSRQLTGHQTAAAAVQEAARPHPRRRGFQGWLRINTCSSLLTSCSTPTRSSIFHCAFSPCCAPPTPPASQPARTVVCRHRHKGLSIVMRSSCCWCHPGLLLQAKPYGNAATSTVRCSISFLHFFSPSFFHPIRENKPKKILKCFHLSVAAQNFQGKTCYSGFICWDALCLAQQSLCLQVGIRADGNQASVSRWQASRLFWEASLFCFFLGVFFFQTIWLFLSKFCNSLKLRAFASLWRLVQVTECNPFPSPSSYLFFIALVQIPYGSPTVPSFPCTCLRTPKVLQDSQANAKQINSH